MMMIMMMIRTILIRIILKSTNDNQVIVGFKNIVKVIKMMFRGKLS